MIGVGSILRHDYLREDILKLTSMSEDVYARMIMIDMLPVSLLVMLT